MKRIALPILATAIITGCATGEIRQEFYDSGALRAEWRYVDGVKQGESILYDEDGRPFFEAYMEQGKMQGVSREYEYFAGRKKLAVLYKCQDDLCKGYDSKGEFLVSEIHFKDGLAHGPAKYFHDSGELETAVNFIKGWREGEATQFYKSGEVRAKRNFVKGRAQGEVQSFFKNGQLKTSAMYKDGNPNGEAKTFYEGGQLRSISTIKPQGEYFTHFNSKEYYPNGQLKEEQITSESGGTEIARKYSEDGVLLEEKNYKEHYTKTFDADGKLLTKEDWKR